MAEWQNFKKLKNKTTEPANEWANQKLLEFVCLLAYFNKTILSLTFGCVNMHFLWQPKQQHCRNNIYDDSQLLKTIRGNFRLTQAYKNKKVLQWCCFTAVHHWGLTQEIKLKLNGKNILQKHHCGKPTDRRLLYASELIKINQEQHYIPILHSSSKQKLYVQRNENDDRQSNGTHSSSNT